MGILQNNSSTTLSSRKESHRMIRSFCGLMGGQGALALMGLFMNMQRFGENMGQLLDLNHASILKSAAAAGQASGQVLHGAAGAMSPQSQSRNPQLPGSTPDIKTEMNPVLNPIDAGPEGSLIGIPGSNQGGNNLTLKGWPLTTAVMLLGGEELHLVAMASRKNDGRCLCFWGFNVALGLYNSCLVMLNLRCLGIVFDLDETLIVANTMRSSILQDALPPKELNPAEKHCKVADAVLCLGTSLQITPACNLPLKSLRGEGKFVIASLQDLGRLVKGSIEPVRDFASGFEFALGALGSLLSSVELLAE